MNSAPWGYRAWYRAASYKELTSKDQGAMSQFVFVLKKKIKTSLSPDGKSRRRRMKKKTSVAMNAVAAVGMVAPIGSDFKVCIRTENKDEASIPPGNCEFVAFSANSSLFLLLFLCQLKFGSAVGVHMPPNAESSWPMWSPQCVRSGNFAAVAEVTISQLVWRTTVASS